MNGTRAPVVLSGVWVVVKVVTTYVRLSGGADESRGGRCRRRVGIGGRTWVRLSRGLGEGLVKASLEVFYRLPLTLNEIILINSRWWRRRRRGLVCRDLDGQATVGCYLLLTLPIRGRTEGVVVGYDLDSVRVGILEWLAVVGDNRS